MAPWRDVTPAKQVVFHQAMMVGANWSVVQAGPDDTLPGYIHSTADASVQDSMMASLSSQGIGLTGGCLPCGLPCWNK